MDFSFNEEQLILASSLRKFANEVLLPKYTHWDRTVQFPAEIWRKMGDMGLFGMRVPETYGGQNLDCVTAGLAIEETARGDFNVCYGILIASFAGD